MSSPIPTRRCRAPRARPWTTSPRRSCGSETWRPSAPSDSATLSMRFFARPRPSTPTRSCSPPGITVASGGCCSEAPRTRSAAARRCRSSSSSLRPPASRDHRKADGARTRGGTTMLVSDVMRRSLVTAAPSTTLSEALSLMTDRRVRHLPVMDAGRLVGIVSDRDIKRVMASPATSLGAHELNYLLDKLAVEQFMTRAVVTVAPVLPIEEAARIMLKERISALPVTDGGRVVGIVTETDVLELVVRALGAGEPSSRLAVILDDRRSGLAELIRALEDAGVVVSSVTTLFRDRRLKEAVVRVATVDARPAARAVRRRGFEVREGDGRPVE